MNFDFRLRVNNAFLPTVARRIIKKYSKTYWFHSHLYFDLLLTFSKCSSIFDNTFTFLVDYIKSGVVFQGLFYIIITSDLNLMMNQFGSFGIWSS